MSSSDKRKKLSCSYKSYLVIKFKEVKIAKEVKRSDGLWRFACGDVFNYNCYCDRFYLIWYLLTRVKICYCGKPTIRQEPSVHCAKTTRPDKDGFISSDLVWTGSWSDCSITLYFLQSDPYRWALRAWRVYIRFAFLGDISRLELFSKF